MNRNRLYIAVDILAALAFIVSFISGYIMAEGFEQPARGATFLSLARGDWAEIHSSASWLLLILILIHLVVHWNWIKNIGRLWKSKI
jgi:thiamine transporter ThiT